MKLMILAAIAAVAALAQTQAAKPEPAPAKIEAPAPRLDTTARFWRLAATAQSIQAQIAASDLGKRLAEAQAQLATEQARLAAICAGGKGWTLGTETKTGSDQGELTCVPLPTETSAGVQRNQTPVPAPAGK
jgi:hypothetical protein